MSRDVEDSESRGTGTGGDVGVMGDFGDTGGDLVSSPVPHPVPSPGWGHSEELREVP